MSRMLPTRIADSAPASERRVFDLLRADPDTENWTVLHSVGLAHRGSKPYGEIDFIVLVPDGGIVCLEIKGGRVRCESGIWFTRDRNDREVALAKSPVMQAREGMFALKAALKKHFSSESRENSTIIASAVIFPDVAAPPTGIEAEPWELIDLKALSGRPINRIIRGVLRQQKERLGRKDINADASVMRSIRAFLRPDFDLVVARSSAIHRAELKLIRLTEEQFDVIDNLELNDHCVVDGAAGTGKTLVALELARRAVASGLRPILLCFNKRLGRWLEGELGGQLSWVGSYHRILRRLIFSSTVRSDFEADLGASGQPPTFAEWPNYAVEALSQLGPIGDLLIVDEAQDLADDGDLCVLDAMLKGGLPSGKWVLLGDFTRQAIYGGVCAEHGFAGFERQLRSRAMHFTVLRLNTNCRNTRQIAEETAMMSGFERMPYRLNAAEGPSVDFRYWSTSAEQLSELNRAIEDLMRDGIGADQITLLSPVKLENSVVNALEYPLAVDDNFTTHETGATTQTLHFATIQSFKGLETPVAIITDLRGIEDAERQAVLYVGMSRARTCLVMLVHESIKTYVETVFRRRLKGSMT